MKKRIAVLLALVLCLSLCLSLTGCGGSDGYTVGVCQLMEHDSLDKATQGFVDALTEEMEAAGKKVTIDTQVAGEASLCTTVINTFVSKKVDLILGNATPALLAAANATGVGPQGFGGDTTCLAVNIEAYPTHIAGLPVAVNVGCHVTRHKTVVL